MASSNTWLPSAAFTTTSAPITSADIPTRGFKALIVTLDVTVRSAGSLVLTVSLKDVASGKYTAIGTLGGTAVSAVSTTVYQVAPLTALTAAPVANTNLLAFALLPEFIQLLLTPTGLTGTYSVGYDLV